MLFSTSVFGKYLLIIIANRYIPGLHYILSYDSLLFKCLVSTAFIDIPFYNCFVNVILQNVPGEMRVYFFHHFVNKAALGLKSKMGFCQNARIFHSHSDMYVVINYLIPIDLKALPAVSHLKQALSYTLKQEAFTNHVSIHSFNASHNNFDGNRKFWCN